MPGTPACCARLLSNPLRPFWGPSSQDLRPSRRAWRHWQRLKTVDVAMALVTDVQHTPIALVFVLGTADLRGRHWRDRRRPCFRDSIGASAAIERALLRRLGPLIDRPPRGAARIARRRRPHNAHENPFEMRPHGARGSRPGLLRERVLRRLKTGKSQEKQFGSDSGPRN